MFETYIHLAIEGIAPLTEDITRAYHHFTSADVCDANFRWWRWWGTNRLHIALGAGIICTGLFLSWITAWRPLAPLVILGSLVLLIAKEIFLDSQTCLDPVFPIWLDSTLDISYIFLGILCAIAVLDWWEGKRRPHV